MLSGVLLCFSQEFKNDTLNVVDYQLQERKLFYTDLFNFSENSIYGDLIPFNSAFYKQPLFPETNWKIDFDAFMSPFTSMNQIIYPGYFPLYGSYQVLNQARYQINSKFSVGGNSFIGNSVFNPIPMNNPFGNNDIKGASMFMEYKVSKKFKIETRVSISNNNSMFPVP